jgi:photosystem II stability/assembly factor-like uncharacterized protein
VPAVLITAAVVAVVLGAGRGSDRPSPAASAAPRVTAHHPASHHRTPRRPAARSRRPAAVAPVPAAPGPTGSRPAGPVPAGFTPSSFTAISDATWWLLGTAPCASPPCTSIVRTVDGGQSFAGIPAPRTDQVQQLRFADGSDGFAYDPQLWSTHDGGAGWQQVAIGGSAIDLAIGGGHVFAIVRSADGTGRLMRSPVGSDAWTDLTGAGDAYAGLWVQGSDVLLESSSRPGIGDELMVSDDSGATFTRHAVPPSVHCAFDQIAPPVVWAHCSTGMMSGVWRSTDDGGAWHAASGSRFPIQIVNAAPFAAASATSAVVGDTTLYRTADGGAGYRAIAAPAGLSAWQYLGFTDATHGVAIGAFGRRDRLYYTTDGGQTYHPVAIR